MGIYSRYSAAFLVLALISPQVFSAVRVPVIQNDEYIRQVLSKQTATIGAVTTPAGDVAFYGAEKVYAFSSGDSVRPTVREVVSSVGTPTYPYGPGAAYPSDPNLTPAAATKVKVKPQVVVPKSNILTSLKSGLKLNPGQILLGAAVSSAVGAVGWIIDEGSTIKVPTLKDADPVLLNSSHYRWSPGSSNYYPSAITACTGYYSGSSGYTDFRISPIHDGAYKCEGFYEPAASWYYNGNVLRTGNSCPPEHSYDAQAESCRITKLESLSDSHLSALDPWVSQQSAEWLGGLIREVCNGSLNPGACYSQMADRSKGMIQGPALAPGPVTSKTTQLPNPDGTTSTRTETTKTDFKLTYGKDHFDVDTEKKTTVTQDGQLVSEITEKDDTPPQDVADTTPDDEQTDEPEYTFDDSPFPEVEPFYEQKYPDGLQGVWDQAKADIDNSNFLSFLRSFVPSFSGSCPSFGMSFVIGNMANFGTHEFQSLCYVFDFIKVILMVSAVFLARQLTFGG